MKGWFPGGNYTSDLELYEERKMIEEERKAKKLSKVGYHAIPEYCRNCKGLPTCEIITAGVVYCPNKK